MTLTIATSFHFPESYISGNLLQQLLGSQVGASVPVPLYRMGSNTIPSRRFISFLISRKDSLLTKTSTQADLTTDCLGSKTAQPSLPDLLGF